MRKTLEIFKAIAALAVGAKAREDAAYKEFLAFYRSLVEETPPEAVSLFGTMRVNVIAEGNMTWGINLTVADYMWWKSRLETQGVRFVDGPDAVGEAMLLHLAKKAETHTLSVEERQRLLALLDGAKRGAS